MTEYRHTLSKKITYFICALIMFSINIISYGNPTANIFTYVVFNSVGIAFLYYLDNSFSKIFITESTISKKYPFRSEVKVSFGEINSLEDSNSSQKLILLNSYGIKLLVVDKDIKGYKEIREIIHKRTKLTNHSQLVNYFRKENQFLISMVMMLLMSLLPAVYFYMQDNIIWLLTLLMPTYYLYYFNKQIVSIYMDHRELCLNYLSKSIKILYSDIIELEQQIKGVDGRSSNTSVIIKTVDEKIITLSGFKDEEVLYKTLERYSQQFKVAT